MPSRVKVELFVSYARSNKDLAGRFLEKYKEQVQASRNYDYFFWQDEKILVGEEWHEAIVRALERCNLGLFLISPAFLGSRYISEHEMPRLIGSDTQLLIPIMLQSVHFERMDLKGLNKYQIFRLEGARFKEPKSYGDCIGNQRDRFVQTLFVNVEQRLDELFRGKDT